jgi:hypothetical protein
MTNEELNELEAKLEGAKGIATFSEAITNLMTTYSISKRLIHEIKWQHSNDRGEIGRTLILVREEALSALEQYSSPDGLMCALTEEVGELARAMMSEPRENILAEAVQVASLAIRIAIEGDPTLNGIRAKRNADAPFPPIPLYTP